MKALRRGGTFYECPRWRAGKWWASDFGRRAVVSIDETGNETIEVQFAPGETPAGLGWLPDGSLLIVLQEGRRIVRRGADGVLTCYADLSEISPWPLNDMVVDQLGRAYVTSMGASAASGGAASETLLTLVEPQGRACEVGSPMRYPNGSVVTPDCKTLIVGESLGQRYTAYPIGSDGALGVSRTWARLGEGPLPPMAPLLEMMPSLARIPDGCCLDADNCIWFADVRTRRVVRVAEGGEILQDAEVPEGLFPFACMLGGGDGRTLLVCAARAFPKDCPPESAVLFTLEAPVQHAGYP